MQPVMVRKYRAKNEAAALEQLAVDPSVAGYTLEQRSWSGPSLARSIITPIILLVAGYLVAGQVGLLGAAVVGILYLVFVVVFAKGALTATFRTR